MLEIITGIHHSSTRSNSFYTSFYNLQKKQSLHHQYLLTLPGSAAAELLLK